eukprot:COSAG01_NODE_56584_length_317_cov_0.954128_1_plen_88_part_10
MWPGFEVATIDPGAYDAIRCKIVEGVRTFQIHFTYGGWMDITEVPGLDYRLLFNPISLVAHVPTTTPPERELHAGKGTPRALTTGTPV